jgi:MFS family permease
MKLQVLLLAIAQALFQTASVLVMTVAALAGALVASRPEWATAPVAAMFLGTTLFMIPASLWMARVGRRPGFITGAALGALGGLAAALGMWLQSLAILSLGTFLVGAYQAFAQFYRFAAAEVAGPAFRPRAISLVLAGGVVAALLGPLLGRVGGSLLQPEYSASFLFLTAASLIAALLLTGLRIPPMEESAVAAGTPRPFAAIARQPAYLVALFGAATGYGVMILAMTATPLAMLQHHHGLGEAATVIQLHVLGMFLPSFFTGALVSRFGTLNVMIAGIALLASHVMMTLTGTGFGSFAGALLLLGIGWNFLYVGSTTLLTSTYLPSEKGRAQAFNEISIFVVGLLSSLSAAALLAALGWQAMNLALLPWLAAALFAILALGSVGGVSARIKA